MQEFGMRYLDLLDGLKVDYLRWAFRAYLLTVKPLSPWRSFPAPVLSAPGRRDPFLYDSVIDQFRVSQSPRYRRDQQNKDETYCNIFVWDVTKAMGAEIPHWVDGQGRRTEDGVGSELDANALIGWLETSGAAAGWQEIDAARAQEVANRGYPVVAAWVNPGGIGHLAVVRPGELSETGGPAIAQSGTVNFNRGTVEQGFRAKEAGREVIYFYHS
jgi:hypothetical protein